MRRFICLLITSLLFITYCYAFAESEPEPYNITFVWAQQIVEGLSQDDIYTDEANAVMCAVSLYMDIAMNKDISDVSSTDAGMILQNELWIGKKDDIIVIGGYDKVFHNAIYLFFNPTTSTVTYKCEDIQSNPQATVDNSIKEASDEYYIIDKKIVKEALLAFYSKLK